MNLKATDNGKYLCVEGGGTNNTGYINARSDAAGPWETLEEVSNDDGTVSIRTAGTQRYFSAQPDGTIVANRATPDNPDPTIPPELKYAVGLYEKATKHVTAAGVGYQFWTGFLCADLGAAMQGQPPDVTGCGMVANRKEMGPYETFEQSGGIPVPIPRAPLPAFDPDSTDPDTGAPLPVHKTLNVSPPPLTDSSFHRANLWGCTPPGGLPSIPGGADGAAQNRLLTYIADRLPSADLARSMAYYGSCGYRHWWWSIPDSRENTPLSLAQYCDMTKRTLDAGLIPCHFLRSKDIDGKNPDPTIVYPWIDALLKINGAFTEAGHAWEASLFYDPDKLRATIDSDATRYPSVRWNIHLQQGYADFGPNGEGHGPAFWNANIAVGVKSLLYQYKTDPAWSAGMMQARTNDCLVRLVQGGVWGLPETVRFVPFEVVAQLQFNNQTDGDGRLSDENTGDLKGYECLCSPGPVIFGGFGNGARRPDGTAL